jgi:hypothetical protein
MVRKSARAARGLVATAVVLAGVAAGVRGANATIVGTTGQIVKISPPASVMPDTLESDTQAFAFDEQQGLLLSSGLTVDITTPGTYHVPNGGVPLTPGTIPAGTLVSSHFVHADPVGNPDPVTGTKLYNGTITFDGTIIGIIVYDATLDSSDGVVGAPGTVYPSTPPADNSRGLEQNDIVFYNDMHTIGLHLALHRLDQVRIITTVAGCRGAGGLTPGFWHNKNGQALIDSGDLALLTSLNLRDGVGNNYDPPSAANLATWLTSGNAVSMAYMLSVQLAAMELNVNNGFVNPATLVNTPSGPQTIASVMFQANVLLGADGYTPSGSPDRAAQETLKNILDGANNNNNWVTNPSVPACP